MDAVNKPEHYQCGGIETIDVIRAKLGPGFGYYCEGNAIKYLTRWRSKGGVEDLRKAQVYLGWLIEFEGSRPDITQAVMAGIATAYPEAFRATTPELLPDKPKWVCIDESKPVAAFDVTDGTLTPLPPATAALIERAEAADDTHVGDLKAGEANG